MSYFPVFVSIVFVTRNQSRNLERLLTGIENKVSSLVSDYELIVVDNASEDDSVSLLRELTGEDGQPNLQVYALTKEVDSDTASWAGLENALGDFIVVVDPLLDDIDFLPEMLDQATSGADVVFATNEQSAAQSISYRAFYAVFNSLYKWFSGIDLAREAPQYRVLSRSVVNFILQHPHPAVTYRHLPATGGFAKVNLSYSAEPHVRQKKHLRDGIDRGMRLLVSTTRAPMRLVTALSLFGAVANLAYSGYVVVIALLKEQVEPGWISLSLQQSGMFFLISLVLLIIGEYILNMASLSNEGPLYHVGQEFTSARMTQRDKLNVEDVTTSELKQQAPIDP
jgi:glycosyltransferase involved in cell wall biosynthesis